MVATDSFVVGVGPNPHVEQAELIEEQPWVRERRREKEQPDMDQKEHDARLEQMAAERHQTVEEMLAEFFAWMRAELEREEAAEEEEEYDWREDAFLDGWGL